MLPTIAVLGGTFDPPHIGHLVLGECVRAQFGVELVLYVPAGDPYRKTGTDTEENRRAGVTPRSVTPAAQRVEMTLLAAAGNAGFAVDDREACRAGPSYTVDTLEDLRAEGHSSIILVLGSDAIADMPNWKQPERIRELAAIVEAPKGPLSPQAPVLATVEMPELRISSTEIRARVAAGRPIRYLVPETVEAYIREHGLYRG